MKKILAIALITLGFQSAQAGWLVEPYLGYNMGSFSGKTKVGGTEIDASDNGLGFGARFAYDFIGLFAGIDYSMMSTTIKYDKPAGSKDDKADHSKLFAVVGYSLPAIPLRFWAGYAFSNAWTVKGTDGASDTKYTGSAFKFGGGYTVIPMLSLNLEYVINSYDKWSSGGSSGNVSDAYSDFKSSAIFFSASVPLSF